MVPVRAKLNTTFCNSHYPHKASPLPICPVTPIAYTYCNSSTQPMGPNANITPYFPQLMPSVFLARRLEIHLLSLTSILVFLRTLAQFLFRLPLRLCVLGHDRKVRSLKLFPTIMKGIFNIRKERDQVVQLGDGKGDSLAQSAFVLVE